MAQPPTADAQQPQTPATKPPGKGLAIASLVCGIGGLLTCGLSAIAGVILGIVALVKIRKAASAEGQGLAIAGLVISALMIIAAPAIALPELGLLIFFREEIKVWVIDTWKEAADSAESEEEDFFGELRYPGGYIIAFCDGHVEVVPAERAAELTWEPRGH